MPRPSPVHFTFVRQHGQLTDCTSTSPEVNHFLDVIKLSRAYHTWVSYAHDLMVFFDVIPKAPMAIDRRDCLAFMKHQHQAGRSDATINRRLAALSALFHELQLLDPTGKVRNPIAPRPDGRRRPERSQSLYRCQPQRLPDVIADEHLRSLFAVLPTWRDRALVLLMWISCLRVSEAVALRFEDIECSRRSLRIVTPKGGHPRVVFMDRFTFEALNRYLDEERGHLFSDEPSVVVPISTVGNSRALDAPAKP
jgi:site-specific recombinase XerD